MNEPRWERPLCSCKCPAFAWSGRMPCTGTYRCLKCGLPEAPTFDGKAPPPGSPPYPDEIKHKQWLDKSRIQ